MASGRQRADQDPAGTPGGCDSELKKNGIAGRLGKPPAGELLLQLGFGRYRTALPGFPGVYVLQPSGCPPCARA